MDQRAIRRGSKFAMKKIVGLVCEGPRDMDLLVSVIDRILPQADISYRYIQPDETLSSPFLTGWKGVWNWCDQYGKSIDEYANGIFPISGTQPED